MSWSRGSLLVALLALPVPLAFADTVIVNTTADESAAGGSCSLREAVAYLNSLKGVALADRPASDANGCKRKESSASDILDIQLSNGETYQIDAEIPVNISLTVKGADAVEQVRPVLHVNGSGRAFRVEVPVPTSIDKTSTLLQLVSTSDRGVSSSDNHTTIINPEFQNVATKSSGSTVYVCRKDEVAAKWVAIGSDVVAADGSWLVRPLDVLPIGINTISVADDADCASVASGESIQVSIYEPLKVVFTGVNVEHADCGSSCPADGGVFYAAEPLSLTNVKISGGKASSRGGALFIVGDASLQLATVELSGNSAPQGAAVYTSFNNISVQDALFAENTGSTILVVANAAGVAGGNPTSIINSTFSGNTGLALSMQEGAVLNALTIVGNTQGGIDFNSGNVRVYNSIIAGNNGMDCIGVNYVPATATTSALPVFKFNLTGVSSGCTTSVHAAGSNSREFSGVLMAGVDANGKCSGAVLDGALCPLADNGGVMRSHLPRLRAVDTLVRDSSNPAINPIINQGYLEGLSGSDSAIPCPTSDQREKSRSGSCDIGAIEVQLISGRAYSNGDYVSTGATQIFQYAKDLGDEELVPVSACNAVRAALPTSPARVVYDVPGCPWIVAEPTKGTVTFNADGSYTYTPFSRFHGFDEFDFQVTTTASILNAGTDSFVRSRSVRATVFMDPVTPMASESLLGGAVDWWLMVCGMVVLGGRMRWSK